MTGGLLVFGDALPTLPAGRAALLQKMLPPLPGGARAVDLFDAVPGRDPASPPAIWHRAVDAGGVPADVVLVVNWTDAPQRIVVPLARIGRPGDAPCIAYDTSGRVRLAIRDGALPAEVRPRASRMFVLRNDTARPCVLSTSRHLVPCVVDLERVAWDESSKTLRGRSRNLLPGSARIPGAPEPSYVLDIHVPPPFHLERAEATSACLATRAGDGLVRVEFPDVTGDAVEWALHFREGERH
jgi:hypothetical protein